MANMRREMREIAENMASMTATQIGIGERDGWMDPRIDAIDRDIAAARQTWERLAANVRAAIQAA